MKSLFPVSNTINPYNWLRQTPNRALDRAYEAALSIQQIEKDYLENKLIGIDLAQSPSVQRHFQTELNRLLRIVRWRLREFQSASAIVTDPIYLKSLSSESNIDQSHKSVTDEPDRLLSKLAVIDEILVKYSRSDKSNSKIETLSDSPASIESITHNNENKKISNQSESKPSKLGILPRSIINTGRRLQRELVSGSNAQALKEFQISRDRTRTAIGFLLALIFLPLLVQLFSKNLIFSPIVEYLDRNQHIEIAWNLQDKREIIEEVEFFKKMIEIETVTGKIPHLNHEGLEKMVEQETLKIAEKYNHKAANAIKNILADLSSVAAFTLILLNNSRQVQILKDFIDKLVYGLSDSAKAFIIILFTDVFVGFHSTHGWEVFLEGVAKHLGIPENRDVIYLFIATFPVALDSIFKYWIFRYLSRISPSAVATYRNMNE